MCEPTCRRPNNPTKNVGESQPSKPAPEHSLQQVARKARLARVAEHEVLVDQRDGRGGDGERLRHHPQRELRRGAAHLEAGIEAADLTTAVNSG
jgi:hypothetical protein